MKSTGLTPNRDNNIDVLHPVIFVQVWRPVDHHHNDTVGRNHGNAADAAHRRYYYTLVGQTFFRPTDLRFQELTLMTHQLIAVRRGDVLGLHFSRCINAVQSFSIVHEMAMKSRKT